MHTIRGIKRRFTAAIAQNYVIQCVQKKILLKSVKEFAKHSHLAGFCVPQLLPNGPVGSKIAQTLFFIVVYQSFLAKKKEKRSKE